MVFSVSLTLFVALISANAISACEDQDQCCLNCWEQCFVEGNSGYSSIYQQIYQIVQTIRNLYLPCNKPHGTCYLLDSSVFPGGLAGSQLMDFERNLASIIALTQPVSKDCNPFFVNKYFRNWAIYPWNAQCHDKCNAARILATTFMRFTQTNNQPSWIGGGCILCDHAFNNGGLSCSANTDKELLVAFANNAIYTSPDNGKCKQYNRVIIGTSPATTWPALTGWASPGLAYQVKANEVNLQATKELLKCMNLKCCPNHPLNQFPIPPARSLEEQNFSYNTNEDTKLKEFSGTFEQFEKNVIDRLPKDGEIRKCRTSRDCPRPMSCRNGRCVSGKGRDLEETDAKSISNDEQDEAN